MRRTSAAALRVWVAASLTLVLVVGVVGCAPQSEQELKQTSIYGAELFRAMAAAESAHEELRDFAKKVYAQRMAESLGATAFPAAEVTHARRLADEVAAADDKLASMKPGAYLKSQADIEEYFGLLAQSADSWASALGSRDPRAMQIGDTRAVAANEVLARIAGRNEQ